MDYRKIITVDPKVRNGQPCIRGMPITVREILDAVASGKTMDEVLTSYPKVTRRTSRLALPSAQGEDEEHAGSRRPNPARAEDGGMTIQCVPNAVGQPPLTRIVSVNEKDRI